MEMIVRLCNTKFLRDVRKAGVQTEESRRAALRARIRQKKTNPNLISGKDGLNGENMERIISVLQPRSLMESQNLQKRRGTEGPR